MAKRKSGGKKKKFFTTTSTITAEVIHGLPLDKAIKCLASGEFTRMDRDQSSGSYSVSR